MKKFLFVLTLLLGTLACAQSPYETAHATTHTINTRPVLGGGTCSATAVGPHTLMTASHCEAPSSFINIDGQRHLILDVARDENEHSFLAVDQTFSSWAVLSKDAPKVGDEVFIFGNPAGLRDVMRKGYLAKAPEEVSFFEAVAGKHPLALYDFNGWMGDSGAAIFNSKGEVVDVVSVGHLQAPPDGHEAWPAFKLIGAFLLACDQSDVDEAVKLGNELFDEYKKVQAEEKK